MPDYKRMYLAMAGAAEDVVRLVEENERQFVDWSLPQRITKILTDAQLESEEIYISGE